MFTGVGSPDPAVLKAARYQPEFIAPVWDYMDNRITEGAIRKGQVLAGQYKKWLDMIEPRFGVSRHVLLAIWSIESSYGRRFKNENRYCAMLRDRSPLWRTPIPSVENLPRTQLIAANENCPGR